MINCDHGQCMCACHRGQDVRHFVPCCYPNANNVLQSTDEVNIQDFLPALESDQTVKVRVVTYAGGHQGVFIDQGTMSKRAVIELFKKCIDAVEKGFAPTNSGIS